MSVFNDLSRKKVVEGGEQKTDQIKKICRLGVHKNQNSPFVCFPYTEPCLFVCILSLTSTPLSSVFFYLL